jgi:hypothetical protein
MSCIGAVDWKACVHRVVARRIKNMNVCRCSPTVRGLGGRNEYGMNVSVSN